MLLPHRECRTLPADETAVELCPSRLWFEDTLAPCEKSGLCKLVLARLRMNDCRFSASGLSSFVESLRSTSRILLLLSASVMKRVGIDFDFAKVDCVGGRGKSDGLVESTLVPLVLNEI